ncbi:MAG: tetraacyldisaccharide 4'-kinase [Bacteroidales bacterium]
MLSLFHILLFLVKLPLASLFHLAISIRHWLYDIGIFRTYTFPIPIICVGNITVGGTGKTPHTQYLADLLTQQDIKTAILSRGYKRKTKGFLYVKSNSSALQVGDEPLLLKRKNKNTIVAVCKKRVWGIQKLLKDYPDLQVIILDDGFQHRSVKAGVSMVLTTYDNLSTQDNLLPLGRLRDTKKQLRRAEMLIVTKCPKHILPIDFKIKEKQLAVRPYQYLYFTHYTTKTPINIITLKELEQPVEQVIALASIAQPEPFFKTLMNNYTVVHSLTFNDHHNFTKRELHCIERLMQHYKEAILITTEKDAMRLMNMHISEMYKTRIYYAPIEVQFFNNSAIDFSKNIFNYVTKNKRISHLY